MREEPVLVLARVEVRRGMPSVLRTLPLALAVLAGLAVLGWLTPGRAAFVLAVMGSMVMSPVLAAGADKLNGGIEFLVSLPVERHVLATGRLLGTVPFAVGGGLCFTGALLLAVDGALPAPLTGWMTVKIAVAVTTGTVLATALGTGVGLRLRPRHFANLVFAGFVLLLAVDRALSYWVPGGPASLLGVVDRPWFAEAAAASIAVLGGGVGWLAHHLTRTGFERFLPERDKPGP